MKPVLQLLASTRLTLLGMILLALGILASYADPQASPWWLAAPLVLLAANLLCAVAANPGLRRRGGLLVFHLALLGIIILAAAGRLTHLDGQVEVIEGSAFSAAGVKILRQGPLHPARLDKVSFVQGPFTVDYAPGLKREHTRSQIMVPQVQTPAEESRLTPVVVGDLDPLILQGYRFSTTPNKGFAVLLTWIPEQGESMTGTVNMPSYPLNDWNQENRWAPPGEAELRLRLLFAKTLDKNVAWTLASKNVQAQLEVDAGGRRILLQPGETVHLTHGSLRYDGLRAWMGYKVFYDPTLPWLFWFALGGVLGMAWYFWGKLRPQGQANEASGAGMAAA